MWAFGSSVVKRWNASILSIRCSHNRRSQADSLGGHSGHDTSLWLGGITLLTVCVRQCGQWSPCCQNQMPFRWCWWMWQHWLCTDGCVLESFLGWGFVPKLLISTTTTKIKTFSRVFPTSLSPFTFSSYWKWFLPCISNALGIHKQFVRLILYHVNARLITAIKLYKVLFLTVNFRLINLILIFSIVCPWNIHCCHILYCLVMSIN